MADEEQVQESQPKEYTQTEWQLRAKLEEEISAKLRVQFRAEYEMLLGMWKEGELKEAQKAAEQVALDAVKKLHEKYIEEQKPPSDAEIQKLLSQEYVEFNLQITAHINGTTREEHFVIRELPQEAEIKLYSIFINKVISKVSLLQTFTQEGIDKPFEERVNSYLGLFQEFPDLMANSVVVILNPFEDRKDVDRSWVQRNISSNRQWNIIEAQIKVNRIKDFLSRLSQSGQSTQTMLGGLSFQQLQQLAR